MTCSRSKKKHRAKIPFRLIYKLSNFAEYKISPQSTIAFPDPNDDLSEKDRKRVGSNIPLFKFKIHYKAIVTKIGLQVLKQTHKPI